MILTLPVTQNFIAQKVVNWLNSEYDVDIQIEKIHLKINGDVALKKIVVKDFKKDSLIVAKEIETSILNIKQLIDGNLYFGAIQGDGLSLRIKTYPGDTLSNLDVFVSKFDSGTPSSGTFVMQASSIDLSNSNFYIIDENQEQPLTLQIEKMNIGLDDFKILDSDVHFIARYGNFLYDRKISVENIETHFSLTDSLLSTENLLLKTSNSKLNGSLKLFPKAGSFSDFSNNVPFDIHISEAHLGTVDLNAFYNGFTTGKEIKINNIEMTGPLNNFEISKGTVAYQNTFLEGHLMFKNILDDTKKIVISGKKVHLETIYNDLATLMPIELGENIPSELKNFDMFSLDGDFVYGTSFLETKMSFNSHKGAAKIEGVLTNLEDVEKMGYNASVITENLNLGTLIGQKSVGGLSADLTVLGNGTTLENLKMHIFGNIKSLRFNGYNYKKISLNGDFKNKQFNGDIKANDENFNLKFKGLADFSNQTTLDFVVNVDKIDLYALNFLKNDTLSQFKGNILIDTQGNDLDSMTGKIEVKNATFRNSQALYSFDDFLMTSTIFENGEKEIKISSQDIVNGSIKGRYKVAEMKKIIQNALGSIYVHYNPYKIEPNQHVDFNFKIHNKIVEIFAPDVKIGQNTVLKGKIIPDEGNFKMQLKSPEINAFDYQIEGINFTVDNKNPLYNAFFEVSKLDLGVYAINDFNLISRTLQDTLFFHTEFKGGENSKDSYDLNFFHTLNEKQESTIEMRRSEIRFRENQWVINGNGSDGLNKIIVNRTADSIKVQNFKLLHRNQHISFSGLFTEKYKNFHAVANNVSLDKVTPEIQGLDLKGTLNGYLSIVQRNNLFYPSSDLFIRHFRLNGYDYGDMEASVFGNDDLSSFAVHAHFINGKTRGFQLKGNVDLDTEKTALLNLDAELDKFNLAPFNPFLEGILYDLRGLLSGNIAIRGSVENPTMEGELSINKGGLGISYLNVNADIQNDAKITVKNQTFELNNWNLTDTAFKTQATLTGNIRHNKLSDWFFDLHIKTLGNRFLVLNTQYTEEALFYGTGFIKGDASIKGALDELVIAVDAVTEEGTQFKIPLSSTETVGDDSFVTFVERGEQKVKVERTLESVKGLELRFEMDVLPTAEIEIIMDQKTGSNLVGRGEGTLLIEINTNGKFNMWGDFITNSGYYNFKYENIIDKRFTVLPGGSISWSGDPLKATLRDLKAAYTLNANPSVLLESSQYNRKIATQVVIKLEGELMQPETVFDITFPDSNPTLISELNYRLEDKDRKQLQAFSLLAQGSFMSDKNTDNRLVAYNLFETAAGLFNQLLSDEDNKLNLGVSYEAGITDSTSETINSDRLGFTVSTQLSESASFNAKIGIPVGGVTRTAVAGNGEVVLKLNPDGSLIGKFFLRENEWQQYLVDRIGYTLGTGISYTVDFSTFKELIHKVLGKDGKIIEERK